MQNRFQPVTTLRPRFLATFGHRTGNASYDNKDKKMSNLYYPCIRDWDTGEIAKPVGPAMPFNAAINYLKQHYSAAWSSANAAAIAVSK